MAMRSICVFCGSRKGRDPAFVKAAEELGRVIAALGWRLVYGAGDLGLMGATCKAAQAEGADILGVAPQHLISWEHSNTSLGGFVVTETMHERKKVMFMNSDAVVVLPGGAGSLDEFFEVLTWRQIGLHDKPLVLLNTNGYWDRLLDLIDHVISQDFADPSLRGFIEVCPTPDAAAEFLKATLET